MPDKTAYELGARKLTPLTGPDPHDDFSQKAAENKKPPRGIGLTEKSLEHSESDKSDLQQATDGTPESDAQGQSEQRHAGGGNDGVSSANPRVISGNDSGDPTFPFKSKR